MQAVMTIGTKRTLRAKFAMSAFGGKADIRWSLCDRDMRDHFRQSRQAPYRGVEPVRRAVNGAIPLAGKRHHLRLELLWGESVRHPHIARMQ